MEIIFAAMVYTAIIATAVATVTGALVGLGVGLLLRHPVVGFLLGGVLAMVVSWSLIWTT